MTPTGKQVNSSGSEFKTDGAAELKLLSPNVLNFVTFVFNLY